MSIQEQANTSVVSNTRDTSGTSNARDTSVASNISGTSNTRDTSVVSNTRDTSGTSNARDTSVASNISGTSNTRDTSVVPNTRARLKAREKALCMVREFFTKRDVIEVDVPALSPFGAIDSYIDLIETTDHAFLHSSPEYALKRLLCDGAGDIFFLGHVFRREEEGKLHSSEFSMIEWYRVGTDEKTFLQEVVDLISLFIGEMPVERLDFDAAFEKHAKPIPESVDTSTWSDEEKFFYTWSADVEPNLGQQKITIITNFPKQHAVLAKTHLVNGEEKARRYEFYYDGIELANGFDELSDPDEHVRRFTESNRSREKLGKATYPIDESLISALKNQGLPENSYGMAAGFDRLLMFMLKKEHIQDILSLSHI